MSAFDRSEGTAAASSTGGESVGPAPESTVKAAAHPEAAAPPVAQADGDSRDAAASAHPGSEVDLSGVSYEALVAEMIRRNGDDPDREGMQKTPERVRKAMEFLTAGYGLTPADAIGDALFTETHQNMVLVRDIELYSLCEHHLLPFFGKAHVAYIPDGQIMGLSKAARLVEVYARRFQVQERLTDQIAQAVWDTIQPQGVAVIVEAYHLCMMMRGVQKQNSKTITSAMRGAFLEDSRTREEFLRLATENHRPL